MLIFLGRGWGREGEGRGNGRLGMCLLCFPLPQLFVDTCITTYVVGGGERMGEHRASMGHSVYVSIGWVEDVYFASKKVTLAMSCPCNTVL